MAGGDNASLWVFFCLVCELGLIQNPGCSSTSDHFAFIASTGRHPVNMTNRSKFADAMADRACGGLIRFRAAYSFSASEIAAISPSLKNRSRPSSWLRVTPLQGLPRPGARQGLSSPAIGFIDSVNIADNVASTRLASTG